MSQIAQISQEFWNKVHSHALQRYPDCDADDLTNDTFVRFFKYPRPLLSQHALTAYLRKVMHCVVIDNRRRSCLPTVEIEHMSEVAVDHRSAEALYLTLSKIAQSALSSEDYTIFSYRIDGHSYREIGCHLNLDPDVVRYRIRRVRDVLRMHLE